MTPDFTVRYRRSNAQVVVELHGELDMYSATDLRRGLACLIDEQGNLSLVLDLRGLTFMDAAGLTVLADAQARIRARGGTIRVANPRRNVQRVLDLTGFSAALSGNAPALAGAAAGCLVGDGAGCF
jgi:anti-anti-sigma factor